MEKRGREIFSFFDKIDDWKKAFGFFSVISVQIILPEVLILVNIFLIFELKREVFEA